MLKDGVPVGVIAVGWPEPGRTPQRQIELLQTFAAQAAIAIENVRLLHETRQALEQQTAIAEVLETISSSVADSAPVFEKVLDGCERLFGTDQLSIFVVDNDDKVRTAAWRGSIAAAVDNSEARPLDDSVTGEVIRERRIRHVPDTGAVPEPPERFRGLIKRLGNMSLAYAPMLSEGRGIGSICVMRQPPRPFSEAELALLKTFCDQAAIAIQNTRLFNETQEALERQTATSEVLRVISSSVTDTQPVFDVIAERSARLTRSRDRVGVPLRRRMDRHRRHLRCERAGPRRNAQALSDASGRRIGRGASGARGCGGQRRRRAQRLRRGIRDQEPCPTGRLPRRAERADAARARGRRRDLGDTSASRACSPTRRSCCCRPSRARP